MRIVTLLVFLNLASPLYSQDNAEVQKFLNDYFVSYEKKILYSEDLESNYFDQLIRTISTNQIKLYKNSSSNNETQKYDNIQLTDKEKEYLVKEMNSQRGKLWKDNLLKNSTVISRDSLTSIFSKNIDRWGYFHRKYGESYYSFTKPIFIRDNSICFFYFSYFHDTSFAGGEFAVFKKENGKWKYYMTIWEWTS